MVAWATLALARAHWADANGLDDATLQTLLDAAQEQCEQYAPTLVRTITANLTAGSPVVTITDSSTFDFEFGRDVGAKVTGTGITGSPTVLSIQSATTATLSANAASTQTDTTLTVARYTPTRYGLAVVQQAHELRSASQRGEQDVIGIGDYAIRARPLTAAVKQLLRPERARKSVG